MPVLHVIFTCLENAVGYIKKKKTEHILIVLDIKLKMMNSNNNYPTLPTENEMISPQKLYYGSYSPLAY